MCLPNHIPPRRIGVEAQNLEVPIIVNNQFPEPGRIKISRVNWVLIISVDLTCIFEILERVISPPIPLCSKRQINRIHKRIFAVVRDDGGSIQCLIRQDSIGGELEAFPCSVNQITIVAKD
uniref:Uncharacterized protein n=1 Tax=Cucumis sativus TaxID=3659 RepID=A0A0A0KPB3_CUCSA